MIKLLPVIAIIGVSIYLLMRAFDKFVELLLFFHSLYSYRRVFDEFEAELFQLENNHADSDGKTLAEMLKKLEKELSAYRRLVGSNRWKYRCWKLFFHENGLVRAITGADTITKLPVDRVS